MLKTAGIVLVVLGASGTGFTMAWGVRRRAAVLRQLLAALEQMRSEIACQRTPLPELFRMLSLEGGGAVQAFFGRVAGDLYLRQEGSVYAILRKALADVPDSVFSASMRQILLNLGSGLGKYDVESQLSAISLATQRLQAQLTQLQSEQRTRVRSYCTLGVCAGLAIAILAL